MALDSTILGNCASEQMEALENDFGDDIQGNVPGASAGPEISAPSIRWKAIRWPPESTTATETTAPARVASLMAASHIRRASSRFTFAPPSRPAARSRRRDA